MLSNSRVEDLNKGVAFLFSLFLIDLDSLATSLVRTTVPNLIQADSSRLHLLVDPRGTALAKLCVMCTVALLKMTEMRKGWCGALHAGYSFMCYQFSGFGYVTLIFIYYYNFYLNSAIINIQLMQLFSCALQRLK